MCSRQYRASVQHLSLAASNKNGESLLLSPPSVIKKYCRLKNEWGCFWHTQMVEWRIIHIRTCYLQVAHAGDTPKSCCATHSEFFTAAPLSSHSLLERGGGAPIFFFAINSSFLCSYAEDFTGKGKLFLKTKSMVLSLP